MKIPPDTTEEDIIEIARQMCAWLMFNDKLKNIEDQSISLLALANGQIIPEKICSESTAKRVLKSLGYKIIKEY